MPNRRDFINIALAATGSVMGLSAVKGISTPLARNQSSIQTLSLEQLDLSKVQLDGGAAPTPEQIRSKDGLRFKPGTSLWVDLRGTAISITATLAMEAGSGKRSVLCRFSTGAEYRDQIVWARGWSPKPLSLSLNGRQTLVIETEGVETRDGITVVLRDATITYVGEKPEAFVAEQIIWETGQWRAQTDGKSGAIVQLSNPRDPNSMNWIRPTGRWGNGLLRIGHSREAWLRPSRLDQTGKHALQIIYRTPTVEVTVRRQINLQEVLSEAYSFTNITGKQLHLAEGSLGILVPLNDRYPGADVCLTQCCHVHLWPGRHSAYVNSIRMGGAAPHLGIVLTEGAITNYSIDNRPESSNDRGWFVLHPEAMTLAPRARRTISWKLFWHQGWDDFFAKAMAVPGFVRLEADEYTVAPGERVRITASAGVPLNRAKMFANSAALNSKRHGYTLQTEILAEKPGEQTIEIETGGKRTLLRALVTLTPMELIRRRLEFIIKHQQKRSPGEPLNGAYLIYDNETNKQVYSAYDHNAGRERVGMGVLGAMFLPHCRDSTLRADLLASLELYYQFVQRELQDESGTVYDDVGRQKNQRLYNYPWIAHLHVAMYQSTKRQDSLQRFVSTCRMFYKNGGEKFYPIGMPMLVGLTLLKEAGRATEHEELLSLFRNHADAILKTGTAYPKSEVNYEQSIVSPAVQILLEMYLVTKHAAYLEEARRQLVCLEAFNGRQPDYRLNDVAIRHWDDFWFGKKRLYGDTQPHYWSTLTALAFHYYAKATGDVSYARRSQRIFRSNLCYFTTEGRASCAWVNPLTINNVPGGFFDPWANDQDWALVNWLTTI
jgi:hypothetical protein